jgi:hypothetical protein
MTTCKITVAGVEFTAAKNKSGKYGVCVAEYQQHLGLSPDFTREIKRGKSMKALQGANVHTGIQLFNVRVGRSTKAFLDTQDFVRLVGVLAKLGNQVAMAWLLACAQEALERRIDHALGVHVTEATREQKLTENFRELCRKEFQPEFTEWLKYDENSDGRPANYALCVNQLKKAAKLPMDTVDNYDQEQLRTWSKAITTYGNYRELGMNHKLALQKVTLKFDKP